MFLISFSPRFQPLSTLCWSLHEYAWVSEYSTTTAAHPNISINLTEIIVYCVETWTGINQIRRKYSRIYREHLLSIEVDAATRLYYIWTHLIQDCHHLLVWKNAHMNTESWPVDCGDFMFTSSVWLACVFSSRIPHLYPNYIPEQYNPPPFNYSDPALQYITHCSPRILDNYVPRQRHR